MPNRSLARHIEEDFQNGKGISRNKLKDLVSQAEAAHVGREGVSNPRNLPWGEREARNAVPSHHSHGCCTYNVSGAMTA